MARDIIREDVPRFHRRAGDMVVSGPNNAIIVLGTDRAGDVYSGQGGPGTGAVHIVAGRTTEGLAARDDRASVYVLSKSNVDDEVLQDSSRVSEGSVSAVVAVADCVRVRARKSLRVVVGRATLTMSSDGRIDIEGDVRLGPGASQRAVRGDALLAALRRHTHPVPNGTSSATTEAFGDILADDVRVP